MTTAYEMEKAASDRLGEEQEAARSAGSDEMMTLAKQHWAEALEQIELVKAAERETARQKAQARLKQILDRRAEVVANVPDCDAVFDAAGMLSLLHEIHEEGFLYPEEDYLREVLALIRK